MQTKDRILDGARVLFNQHGYSNTSMRQIANKIEISQGNLTYHYKTKTILLERLYFELVLKMDKMVGQMMVQVSLLSQIFIISGQSMSLCYDYRFFFRDMHSIFRVNHNVKQHYIELQNARRVQFLHLFKMMCKADLLKPEEFKDEYARLYERMNIVGDNWINSLELFNVGANKSIYYYQLLLFEMIYPYLTKEGKSEFQKIKNK